MNTNTLHSFSFGVAAFFVICEIASADYCVAGDVDVSVYWNMSQGIVGETYEVKCTVGELSIDLSEELAGPNGNTAGAQSIASLPVAWQSAYGSEITPNIDAGIASGRGGNRQQDRLIITVTNRLG